MVRCEDWTENERSSSQSSRKKNLQKARNIRRKSVSLETEGGLD